VTYQSNVSPLTDVRTL